MAPARRAICQVESYLADAIVRTTDPGQRALDCLSEGERRMRVAFPSSVRLASAILAVSLASAVAPAPMLAAAPDILAVGRLSGVGQGRAGVEVFARLAGATDRPIVATTTTDVAGNYQLPAPALTPDVEDLAASNDGYLNLMVVAAGQGIGGVTFTSARVQDGHISPELEPTSATASADTLIEQGGSIQTTAWGNATASPSYDTCYPKTTLATSNSYTTVGEIHTWTDDAARFTYGQTADSDIAVGVSTNGTNWSLDGTYHVGNSASSAVSMTRSGQFGKLVQSSFHYEKNYYTNCPISYAIEVTGWNSGMVEGSSVSSVDGKCSTAYASYRVIYGTATTFDRSSSSFVTFNGAVTLFGASLTAKSGASQYVKIHYDFGTGTSQHTLCGNNAMPTTAARIYAGG